MKALQSVILIHHPPRDKADATPADLHFDWLFESADTTESEHTLESYRLMTPLHEWEYDKPEKIVKMPMHRKAYLTYEGPISDNRGEVERLDAGTVKIEHDDGHYLLIHVEFEGFKAAVKLTHVEDDVYYGVVV